MDELAPWALGLLLLVGAAYALHLKLGGDLLDQVEAEVTSLP